MMANHIMLMSCQIFLVFLFMMAQSQPLPSTDGFISLDCGLSDNQNYTDSTTHLPYTSDSQYINTGVTKKISANYINSSLPKYDQTVRSFPNGGRNCYTFENFTAYDYYLVRATFFYGNYDGLQSVQSGRPIAFDLYLGANLWRKVNISDASKEFMFEAILYALSSKSFVCLVNTNSGVPFISALEIRPFKPGFQYTSISAYAITSFMYRFNYGETNQTIRYPYDRSDRLWKPYQHNPSVWTGISTNNSIDSFLNLFAVPTAVMQTAVTPINSPNLTALQWKSETILSNTNYYVVVYLADLQAHTTNATRALLAEINGRQWPYDDSTPKNLYYLYLTTIYSSNSPIDKADDYVLKLYKTAASSLPPIINAIEIYAIIANKNPTTSSSDVQGIMGIKKAYGLERNWIGDPCSPKEFEWNGLNCSSSSDNKYAYITTINLTSSGLKGEISQSFKSFQAVENLDLSFNNLTGPVPEFLANMGSLVYLNLAGNNFTGLIPDNLIKKSQNGFLTLILESDEFRSGSHRNNKKKIIVIASVASAILLAIMILVVWKICRKKQALRADNQLHVDFRLFTHEQLKQITNNFSEAIGRGGFGTVYSGLIDEGTKVAVKVPNIGTATAMRQFLSEAKSLTQVHHRNLVTLIGYCMDKNFYGLVYEYMPNGSLYDHLASNTRICRVLNWAERLRIAFEAAQGLDYLHTGCMIAHRDVKSSNILLGPNFEAKIADFGLAKMFNAITGVSTISLCGTPGYIDPEVRVAPLSERSDVYSFGVVLLEIITGEPPIMPGRENVNLIKHVKQSISTGSIDEIMDSRLRSSYNEKIVWKVIDLAIRCTEETSEGRPIMAEVVTELRDCLSEESRWANRDMNIEEGVKSQASPINSYLVEMGPSVR